METTQTTSIIVHQLEAMPVGQRASDGYINATAMCQAAGKEWSDYRRLANTEDFLREISGSLGIPRDLLTHTITRGPNHERGTWVHPQVAVNLAQWCSARFAAKVAGWVVEWAATGKNPMQQIPVMAMYDNELLQKAMTGCFHKYLSRTNGNYVFTNADMCKAHSDYGWYPSAYKLWAKAQGWPSKHRTSGLAVLRRAEKPSAAAISTEKWAMMNGVDSANARQIGHKAKELFRLCEAAGMQLSDANMMLGSESDDAA